MILQQEEAEEEVFLARQMRHDHPESAHEPDLPEHCLLALPPKACSLGGM